MENSKIQAWSPIDFGHNIFIPIKHGVAGFGWAGLSFDGLLWWISGMRGRTTIDQSEWTTEKSHTLIKSIFTSEHSPIMDESWAEEILSR